VKLLGFSEKEVGHFTVKKWLMLFEHYQKHHNFKAKGYIYKIEPKFSKENPNGWLPF
jgi:hypothetical protein